MLTKYLNFISTFLVSMFRARGDLEAIETESALCLSFSSRLLLNDIYMDAVLMAWFGCAAFTHSNLSLLEITFPIWFPHPSMPAYNFFFQVLNQYPLGGGGFSFCKFT